MAITATTGGITAQHPHEAVGAHISGGRAWFQYIKDVGRLARRDILAIKMIFFPSDGAPVMPMVTMRTKIR